MKGEPSSVGTPLTAIIASRFARSVQTGARRKDGMPTKGNLRLTSVAGSVAGSGMAGAPSAAIGELDTQDDAGAMAFAPRAMGVALVRTLPASAGRREGSRGS